MDGLLNNMNGGEYDFNNITLQHCQQSPACHVRYCILFREMFTLVV
jgi:hypothetical protein